MKKRKARRPGRNKRRTAVTLKRAATPTTREREQCPYCPRDVGSFDPDTCRLDTPCTSVL